MANLTSISMSFQWDICTRAKKKMDFRDGKMVQWGKAFTTQASSPESEIPALTQTLGGYRSLPVSPALRRRKQEDVKQAG